jgi:hypothetical protein
MRDNAVAWRFVTPVSMNVIPRVVVRWQTVVGFAVPRLGFH